MIALYLVCLVFGGILLLVSVFGGDLGGDADFDASGDVDFDADADLDASADVDSASGNADGHGLQRVFQFLSFRALVFFLAFFGLTGSLLSFLGSSGLVTFAAAAAMGFAGGSGIQTVIRYLQRTESGQGFQLKQLEGSAARVLVECTRERRGKIVVDTRERTMQLLAQVADAASRPSYAPGDTVIVVHVRDGVAYVSGEDLVM